MSATTFVWLAALALALQGCAAPSGARTGSAPTIVGPAADPVPPVRVVFRDGRVFAREGAREWPIAEVGRDQMLWAPDGRRFAYLKQNEAPATSRPTASAEPPISRGARVQTDAPVAGRVAVAGQDPKTFHIVIRNIRGDSVNEFPVYRPGRPTELDWIDNNTLGYLAPPDETGDVYVLHSARTAEILRIYRGARFVWAPGRRQLAYVANPKQDQLVKVDDEVVWPRGAVERPPAPPPAQEAQPTGAPAADRGRAGLVPRRQRPGLPRPRGQETPARRAAGRRQPGGRPELAPAGHGAAAGQPPVLGREQGGHRREHAQAPVRRQLEARTLSPRR